MKYKLYSLGQVAKYAGKSRSYIYLIVKKGFMNATATMYGNQFYMTEDEAKRVIKQYSEDGYSKFKNDIDNNLI